MKYIIYILFLVCFGLSVKAQSGFPSQTWAGWIKPVFVVPDSGSVITKRDTNWIPTKPAMTVTWFHAGVDTTQWFWTGLNWKRVSAAQIDTTSLSNRINLKLNISDTASMLSPYLRKIDTTNKWVQNIYARNDSLFKLKNGTETFVHIFPTSGSGTVTSVALSMPAAFTVSGSPITTSGTFNVSGAGTSSQYIRGDGTLATMDTSAIPNFFSKVRSEFSGTSPITYNSTTGIIGILNANSTGQKGAATFNNSDFTDNGSALISLAPIGSGGSCLNCQLTIDTKGRITSFADGSIFLLSNAPGAGDTLVVSGDTIKRIYASYGLISTPTASNIALRVDTTLIQKLITANNGLTKTGNNIQLGGPLVQTTNIAVGNNELDIIAANSTTSTTRFTIDNTNAVMSGRYEDFSSINTIYANQDNIQIVSNQPTKSRRILIDSTTGIQIGENIGGIYKGLYINKNTSQLQFNGYTSSNFQTIDTSFNALVVDATGKIFKRAGGGGGTPSLTYKNVGYGGIGNTLSGEAAFQYDSITNKLTVDSIELKQSREDSTLFRRLSPYLAADTLFADGNSITVGLSASPLTDSGYVYRLNSQLGLIINNIAVSGTGMVSIANRFLINKNPGNTVMTTVMGGLNDGRRNGSARNTLNKIINGHKAIFANQYLKAYTNAGTGGVNVTRYGSWANSWNAQAEGGKTTVGAYTSTVNDSIVYTFTDSTVIVGLMGGDGSGASYVGTDIDVYIDGVFNSTINTNNQTDGISDGSGLDNKRCAMAFYFGGLSLGSHSIKLIKKSTGGGGYMIFDYFGHFVDRSAAYAMLWFHAPYLTAAGYATSPANGNNTVINTINGKIDSLIGTPFIKWYPTYRIQTNNCYDTTSGTSGDGIHPNNTGHRQIFNCAMSTLNLVNGGGGTTGKMYYTNEFHGVVEGVDQILLTVSSGDIRYIQNQNTTTQIANFTISGTGTSGQFNTAGSKVGGAISNSDRQSNGFFAGISAVGSNSLFGVNNNASPTDAKRYDILPGTSEIHYRLVSDDLNSATDYMRVNRSGISVTSIQIPTIEVAGTSTLIGEIHSGTTSDYGSYQFQNTGNFYQTGGSVFINGMQRPPSGYNVLVHGLTDSVVYQIPSSTFSTGNTIYTGDGRFTTNRTVSGANNNLKFDSIGNFQINADTYIFEKKNATVPYTAAILGSGNVFELGYTPTPTVFSKGAGITIDTNNNASLGATQIPSTAPLYATGGSTYVSGFQNQGGTFLPVATITTGTTSVALTYYFIQCDASGGNITLNLPAASTAFAGSIGIKYVFYRTDNTGNTVTVNAAGGDSINGTGSFTLVGQYTTKQLQCVSTSAWAQY